MFVVKFLLTAILILIGAYWAGDAARQNSSIDALISDLERGYAEFNKQLSNITISNGLRALRRVYGWIAVVTLLLFLVAARFLGQTSKLLTVLSLACAISGFLWFAIRWCIGHRQSVLRALPQVALIIVSPVFAAILDAATGSNFMQILASPLYRLPPPFAGLLPQQGGPLLFGVIFSGAFLVIFFIYYLLTWVVAAPAAFLAAVMVAIPVALAKFISYIAPKTAFFGFTFVVFAIITFALLWA